jgi:uncharacterized protein (TIGR00251 family)
MIRIRCYSDCIILPVRVTPRGGRDCLLPFEPGDAFIRLKVSAPPEDGKANAAVIRLLAEVLGLPKSRVAVSRGEKSREKQIRVQLEQSDSPEALTCLVSNAIGGNAAQCLSLELT